MSDERFNRDLRAALERIASASPPNELRHAVAAIPDEEPASRRPRLGRATRILAALAAVIVLVAVAGLAIAVRPPVGPAPSASSSPAPSAQPATPEPSPIAPADSGGLRWQVAPLPPTGAASLVTPLGSGLLAVGQPWGQAVSAGQWLHPTFARSADGLSWQTVPDSPAFAGIQGRAWDAVLAAAPAGPGLVAVGASISPSERSNTAEAWTTPDGTSWTRGTVDGAADAAMWAVARRPAGYVAVGSAGHWLPTETSGMTGAAAWTSGDGLTWTRAPDSPDFAGAVMQHIVSDGTQYVAAGADIPGRAGNEQPPIWTSPDGLHWTRVAAGFAFPAGDITVTALLATPSGFIATGSVVDGGTYAWSSSDGHSWSQLQIKAVAGPASGEQAASLTALVVFGGTVVAVGGAQDAQGDQLRAAVWELEGPGVFVRIPSIPAFEGNPMDQAVISQNRLLVAGQRWNWIATLLQPPEPTPSPTPVAVPSAPPMTGFTTPPAPSHGAPWQSLIWTELAADDPLARIQSMVRWHGGYVVLGAPIDSPGATRTPVWTSTDGSHWVPLDASVFGPSTVIARLVAFRDGLAAITWQAAPIDCTGGTCTRSYQGPIQVWTSANGQSWTPHPIALFAGSSVGPPLLAAGPAGLVAAVSGGLPIGGAPAGVRMAISSDGARWLAVPAGAFPAGFWLGDLAGTPSGYVAVGAIQTGQYTSDAAAVWSSDGRTWSSSGAFSTAARDGIVFASSGLSVAATRIVTGTDGFIATGSTFEAVPGFAWWWQSTDGHRWTSLTGYPPLGQYPCTGECSGGPYGVLAGDGTQMVALRGGPKAGAWVSAGGAAWRSVAMRGAIPGTTGTEAVVLPDGVLLTDGTTSWFGTAGS